jgi:hypothetical protein
MKHNISWIVVIIFGALAFTSCKKAGYLTDEGVHNPQTPLTTYEYLKQHSWHSFDTFILVIDHYNMKDELNNAATAFAVTDYSVKKFMDLKQAALKQINENLKYTIDSLYKDVPADSVRQYLFDSKITLADAKLDPEVDLIKSRGKTQCAFSKVLLTTSPENYLQFTTTPTYSLYYTSVRGTLDVPGVVSPPGEIDIKVQCQTTGIQTASGTTLHVLTNQHTFVRF